MRTYLLFILSVLHIQFMHGQIFPVETIKNSGDNDKRINLVILGDGYQTSELDQFETDAIDFMNALFLLSPFTEYEDYFNVHIINVPSNESGASHPGTASDEHLYSVPVSTVDNYFGSSYDSFGIHRLLYTPNSALISTVLANNFPTYDVGFLLVNAPYYGGSGGMFPIASTGEFAEGIAIHELGHTFSELQDEYWPGIAIASEAKNMTQDSDPATIRWKNWLGTNGVGIYAYSTSGVPSTWFRPHQSCIMRSVENPYCSVCIEGLLETIHSLVSPIDSYTPANATLMNPAFPMDFQLNLIEPMPNTLENTWTLNSSPFEVNMDMVTIEESDLNTGSNELSVVVIDATTLINIDNYSSINFHTITWTIENTLGVQDIEENQYDIKMYPNPANNLIHFSMNNSMGETVRVEIISVDGKQVASLDLINGQVTPFDISNLSQGIYVVHFYNDETPLLNRKLVKN